MATKNSRTTEISSLLRHKPLWKTEKLHDDIICVSNDIKPALLLDYINLDIQAIEEFIISINTKDVAVFSLNEDRFVLNKTNATIPTNIFPCPFFVDITKGLLDPLILNKEITIPLKKSIKDFINTHVNKQYYPKSTTIGTIDEDNTQLKSFPVTAINFCTVYGYLLGYPVVYWFDEEKGYDMDFKELVRCVVTVFSDQNLLCQKEHILYSFSYPFVLDNKIKPHIKDWFQILQTHTWNKVKDGMRLSLQYERICLPHLVL